MVRSKISWSNCTLLGSNTSGNGDKMSKNAVEQIDKVIKFLEEGTN
ncbi:hypothetical protein [Borreliella burgdorferi]|nr:hypothetical protein [Borreliella burgdorferi]